MLEPMIPFCQDPPKSNRYRPLIMGASRAGQTDRGAFMRLLMIHADRFSFEVTEATSVAEYAGKLADDEGKGQIDEALVAFMAVETSDESDPNDVAAQAAMEIRELAGKLGATRVMVYPYAHLSGDLAKPRVATKVMDLVASALGGEEGLELHRAPFGYYKAFDIRCKGHPLSELALTIVPGGKETRAASTGEPESDALAAEKALNSEWRIYTPDGRYTPADEFNFKGEKGLKDLFAYEITGTRVVEDAPPHIKLMREHEFVDYEPASDAGNFRWYPKGLLMKRLLERHVTDEVVKYGAMEVETPIMYDYDHPALSKYLNRFPARQYLVQSDEKEYFLRFAACFGQYMIQRDMVTSYRDLPMRLYELSHFSFRREQSGEVAGLRRLRSFTMPDMHTLVRDVSMAKEEFIRQVRLCKQWLDDVDIPVVGAVRFVRSFLDENPGFAEEIVSALGRPVIVEIWDERFFYFVAKFELNFVDAGKKAACLSTVQIDVENTERFDITYVEDDGSKKNPLLMHTSVSGSVDRVVYAILEEQAMRMKKGKKAFIPVWLAPTQLRVLPVSDQYNDAALELAEKIPFRVDVDDRDLKVGKKIREAEKEWLPYVLVFGQKEQSGEMLTVRPRLGDQEQMSLDALIERVRAETTGMPYLALNTPRQLSRRPIFVG